MPTLRPFALMLLAGCAPAPVQPGPATPEPVAEAEPAFEPIAKTPFKGCTRSDVQRTISWKCSDHLIILVSHDGTIPDHGNLAFQGGDPEIELTELTVQGASLLAQVQRQPGLRGQPRHITVIAPHEPTARVGSCALRVKDPAQEPALLAWCSAALTQALSQPPASP